MEKDVSGFSTEKATLRNGVAGVGGKEAAVRRFGLLGRWISTDSSTGEATENLLRSG